MSWLGAIGAGLQTGAGAWERQRDRDREDAFREAQMKQQQGQFERTETRLDKGQESVIQLQRLQARSIELENELAQETNPLKKQQIQQQIAMTNEQIVALNAQNKVNTNEGVIGARIQNEVLAPTATQAGIEGQRASAAAARANAGESAARTGLVNAQTQNFGKMTEKDYLESLAGLSRQTDNGMLTQPAKAATDAYLRRASERLGIGYNPQTPAPRNTMDPGIQSLVDSYRNKRK